MLSPFNLGHLPVQSVVMKAALHIVLGLQCHMRSTIRLNPLLTSVPSHDPSQLEIHKNDPTPIPEMSVYPALHTATHLTSLYHLSTYCFFFPLQKKQVDQLLLATLVSCCPERHINIKPNTWAKRRQRSSVKLSRLRETLHCFSFRLADLLCVCLWALVWHTPVFRRLEKVKV